MTFLTKIFSSLFFLFSFSIYVYALTVEEIVKLKAAGVDEKTIQMLIEKGRMDQEGPKGMGVKEVERPDGGKDKIYFSITTPEEERKNQEEEREKLERSLDMLRNIIIDERRKQPVIP